MTLQEQRTAIVRERRNPDLVTEDHLPGRQREIVDERRVVSAPPSAATLGARLVMLVFGLIQLVIGLRIVLLALDAREGNAIVSGILSLSGPLVGPFEGILRTNALHASGAVLDLAAVLALVGWTVVELIVLAVVRLGRPGDAV